MDLSPEDALRLHILLANDLHAVCIDEATLTVYGLTHQAESRVVLNATGRDDRYACFVRFWPKFGCGLPMKSYAEIPIRM